MYFFCNKNLLRCNIMCSVFGHNTICCVFDDKKQNVPNNVIGGSKMSD